MNFVGEHSSKSCPLITAIWRVLSLASVVMTLAGLAYATWFNQAMAGINPFDFIVRFDLIVAYLLLFPPVMYLLKVNVGLLAIPIMLVALAFTWTSFVAGTQLLVITSVFNLILLRPIIALRDQRLLQKRMQEIHQ